MTKQVKIALAAAAALGGAALMSTSASAMPASGINPAVAASGDVAAGNIENVRFVCGPFRCFYRPGYWGYRGFYGRRFYGGYGYGWRRRW